MVMTVVQWHPKIVQFIFLCSQMMIAVTHVKKFVQLTRRRGGL